MTADLSTINLNNGEISIQLGEGIWEAVESMLDETDQGIYILCTLSALGSSPYSL